MFDAIALPVAPTHECFHAGFPFAAAPSHPNATVIVRLRVSAPAGTDALLCIKDPDRRFDRSDAGVKRALGLLANDEIIGFLYLGTRVCGASDPVRAVVEDFVCLVNVSNVAFRMSFSE